MVAEAEVGVRAALVGLLRLSKVVELIELVEVVLLGWCGTRLERRRARDTFRDAAYGPAVSIVEFSTGSAGGSTGRIVSKIRPFSSSALASLRWT